MEKQQPQHREYVKEYLTHELEKCPNTLAGGVRKGETLYDFLQEIYGDTVDLSEMTLAEANDALRDCGIKQIEEMK